MARKLEFGAGIAAAVLATLALIVLLVAPVVCLKALVNGNCPSGAQVTLIQAGAPFGFWALFVLQFVLLYAGAAGAIADARFGRTAGLLPLWIASVAAFIVCALTGIGTFFAPAVFALAGAGYAGAINRAGPRRPFGQQPAVPAEPGEG